MRRAVEHFFYEYIALTRFGRNVAKICEMLLPTKLRDGSQIGEAPQISKPIVAMLTGDKGDRPSQTFIRLQRDKINAKVNFYTGGIQATCINESKLASVHNIARFANYWKELKRDSLSNCETLIAASFVSENTDVVYAQFGNNGARILNVCKALELPLIVHFRGYDSSRKSMLRKYEKKYLELFEYASLVIVVSHDMADRLVNLGCPREKIVYNPSAPNDVYYHIQPIFNKKLFVGAGRFVQKKAPQNTIRAFMKVLEKHPDAKLILAGGGKLFSYCKKMVKQNNLNNSVYLPGAFTPEQLTQWLSEATAFVQHSITAPNGDKEGTPNSISEASLSGLPIVSTFHAGIPDVIIDRKTGLLSNEGDIDAMAKNMIWILDNPQEAQKMGSAGKENIWRNFNLNKCIGILDEVIRKSVRTNTCSRKSKNKTKT
ncbi:MAG: glycosyltransferase [Bacteroidales bacterium]|nr:glycosyltransferase [Bacteroidales bacterium]